MKRLRKWIHFLLKLICYFSHLYFTFFMKQEQILIRRQVTVFSSLTSLILKIVELVASLIIHFRSYPENNSKWRFSVLKSSNLFCFSTSFLRDFIVICLLVLKNLNCKIFNIWVGLAIKFILINYIIFWCPLHDILVSLVFFPNIYAKPPFFSIVCLMFCFLVVVIIFLDKTSTFVRVLLQNVTLETEICKGISPTWDEEFVL